MRAAAALTALILLAGCAGGHTHRGGRLSNVRYLSALEAVPAPMRVGSSGAPIVGVVVSGTITNQGSAPLHCTRAAFLLVAPNGDGVPPSTSFCALPSILPAQSTFFNATFAARPRDGLKLRFEHGDGTYEIHDLIVPPAG